MGTCRFKLMLIMSIEHENNPLIAAEVVWLGSIDKKSHIGAVQISIARADQHRLAISVLTIVGAMRQKTAVTIGPKMLIQRIASFFAVCLHNDPPTTLQTFFKQRRQRVLKARFRQMVKQHFRHWQIEWVGWFP